MKKEADHLINKFNQGKISIHWEDGFYMRYVTYFFGDEMMAQRLKLNNRDKLLTHPSLSYRVINHWEKNGLIDVDRGEEGTGWRKYSVMDIIWINIMAELRGFGVSIDNIRKVREQLTEHKSVFEPSVYPMLELYTTYFMSDMEEVYILIPDDFIVKLATQNQIEMAKMLGGICSHISISLHDIIKRIYKVKDLKLKEDHRINLSNEESALVLAIRTRAYKAINVKMKNGKINRIEKDVELTEKQIHKILKNKNFDSITIERENGKIVNVKQILKEKF